MGTTCAATLFDPAWQCEVYSDRGAATYDEWKVGLQKAATVLNPGRVCFAGVNFKQILNKNHIES